MFNKKNLLGVGFTDEGIGTILEYVEQIISKKEKKYFFVTPNPELLVIANKDPEYKKVLNDADLALIDGVGILIAGKILGVLLKHKISGIDLMESVCKRVAEKPITVGLLGGGHGVAEDTAECLKSKYPGLRVTFAVSELSKFVPGKEEVSSMPNTDVLFVAFGSPRQEIWLHEHLKNLPITIGVGVGGAFDMISGKVIRAPGFVRSLGLEWLFRLVIQPWRIKRQLKLLEFILLVIRERIKASS